MPKINRARIINFSYNNNNRHIIDEIFDFYGGENALLNLKNGGGKSVLVQTLFQPVIPKVRLMGRRIEDFFKSMKTPSYIMLEWILEDKGGYLLTGIGMARRESRTVEEGEAGIDLKYFTFTVKYREANEFDIRNIPLAKKINKAVEIMDFKEAKSLLDSKKPNEKYEITIYSEDERKEYADELANYGISQEEWRSVILNINQTEGGVIEIFDKCKSSQQLLNDWILKSIEKAINGEEDKDNKKLGQMLENVVNDIIDNEKFIRDKEILQGFMKRSEEIIDELNKVEECRGREKNKKSDIAELWYYADKKRSLYEEEKHKNENRIEELNSEIEKIALEEISKEYYDSKEALEKLKEELESINSKISETEDALSRLDYDERLEKASQEYSHIKSLQESLKIVEINMERLSGECDEQKRIEALEYTLKIKYEEQVKNLQEKLDDIYKEKDNNEKSITENKGDKKLINDKLKLKNQEYFNLERDIKDFRDYEDKLKKSLSLNYGRNILQEVEKGYFDKTLTDFNKKLSDIQNEIASIEGIIKDKEEEKILLQDEAASLTEKDKVNAVELSSAEKEADTYSEAEEGLRPVLERHNIDWSLRFNSEANKRQLEDKINEKETDIKRQVRELNAIAESLECIKSGSFNLPKKLLDFLKKEGIQYITGENYLRALSKNERERLLEINPLLPYSFVMTTEQIEGLKDIYFDFPVNQMIPLIDYKDLELQKSGSGPIVSLKEGISFLCIYDKNIVDFESLSAYEEKLKKDETAYRDDIEYKEDILKQYRKDLNMLESFNYSEDYSKNLEKKILDLEKTAEKISMDIKSIKINQQKIDENLNSLKDSKNNLMNSEAAASKEIEDIKDLIERDKDYIENLEEERILSKEIKTLENNINEIEAALSKIEVTLRDLAANQRETENNLKDFKAKYELFKDKKTAEIAEGDISALEKELSTLQSRLSSDIERLKEDEKRYNNEISEKRYIILSYDIPAEIYTEHEYNEENLKKLQKEKKLYSASQKQNEKAQGKINEQTAVQNSNITRSQKQLQERNAEPISKSEILLNFTERRQNAKNESVELALQNNKLSESINKLLMLCGRITDAIDIAYYEFKGLYQGEMEELLGDFDKFKKELTSIRNEGRKYKDAVIKKLSNIFADYKDKHEVINNIYEGITPLVDKLDLAEDNYYFLGERMLLNMESLKNVIRACELRLEGVENSKKDLVQHCYYHGKRVFDEIEKVIENSSIRLEGHNRPIPMLKIEMEPLSEEKESKEKMRIYIEDCISQISKDIKSDVKNEEIQKKMSRLMSTKELLNELSELSKAKVYAYKIDININNRGYKTWEQVMKENSGGERFVAFFTVIVALMSYTRLNGKSPDDYRRNRDTKVLIMDNPFGPISSEHLLKPLFQIAKKYNTQLICLTDLKQNSILNCFDLIYMIKIRTNILGTNEYLEIERELQPESDLKQDESLEKAVFRAEDVEQMKLI